MNTNGFKFIETIIYSIVSCSLLSSFFIVFPVTIDRSLTVFILRKIEVENAMTEEQVQHALKDEYVTDGEAGKRRILEQELSGNIKCDKSCVLTKQGKVFLGFSLMIDVLFRTAESP